jgi:hypothetical protein
MVQSLVRGTLTGVTDGSYDHNTDPTVCSARWIIMDITTGQQLVGSFAESSDSAGSYCGKLLGLCAVSVIILALTKVGQLSNVPAITIWCDNKGVISKASRETHRICSGMDVPTSCGYLGTSERICHCHWSSDMLKLTWVIHSVGNNYCWNNNSTASVTSWQKKRYVAELRQKLQGPCQHWECYLRRGPQYLLGQRR